MAASIRGTAVTTAIAVVASLGLLLPGTPTVAAGAEQARLSVAPDQGSAGSDARVDGAGFADDRAVEIRWEPTGERLGTATGPKFSTTVSIPDDAAEGSHAIEARDKPPGAGASEAHHATTPFTVTVSGDPDDAAADEDEASGEEQADGGDTDPDGDAETDGDEEEPSAESDGSKTGDDESEPSEEPPSADGDVEDGSGDTDFNSGTPGERDGQRTDMSPDPRDDDAPKEDALEESDGQNSDNDERDTDRSDSADGPAADEAEQSDTGQRDAERDSQAGESADPSEESTGKAETATAPSREGEDDDEASSSAEDRSSATTFRKSSGGPPAAVSHEIGPVQPSAMEEPPDVDFAAAPDSEAFQVQDALPPEVAADGRTPAPPEVAVRERLATASGSRHTPTEATRSTPQGTPAAVGTQAAAPNSEEVSLLALLTASGALLVWHRRQPLLRRR